MLASIVGCFTAVKLRSLTKQQAMLLTSENLMEALPDTVMHFLDFNLFVSEICTGYLSVLQAQTDWLEV